MPTIPFRNSPKIAFRVDASIENGTGHVIRCLTLAKKLKSNGCNVFFISRNTTGNLNSLIQQNGFLVHILPLSDELPQKIAQDVALTKERLTHCDLLILDNYFFDVFYENEIQKGTELKIAVIDDLANRRHNCNLLIDQNAYIDFPKRYDSLVSAECTKLLGPKYCLLREEFFHLRQSAKIRTGPPKRILILFGGSDPSDETTKALAAAQQFYGDSIILDIVVGSSNPQRKALENKCAEIANVHFYCQTDRIAELMKEADLAIGAGGTTSWERCCLGLPAIVSVLAENQIDVGRALAHHGAALTLENNYQFSLDDYFKALTKISDNMLSEMSHAAYNLVDGLGTERVCKAILELLH